MQHHAIKAFLFLLAICVASPACAGPCNTNNIFSVNTIWGPGTVVNTQKTIYTAPAGGNGVKISAIYLTQNNITGSTGTGYYIYQVHNGVQAFLIEAVPQFFGGPNILVADAFATLLLNPPSDENGNPYFLLQAGDSLMGQNAFAVPSSGATSGNYVFTVQGQQC